MGIKVPNKNRERFVNKSVQRFLTAAYLLLFLIFGLPIILISTSVLFLYIGLKNLNSPVSYFPKSAFAISATVSNISKEELICLSYLPILGRATTPFINVSDTLYKISLTSEDARLAMADTVSLLDASLGLSPDNQEVAATDLVLSLDKMYADFGFIESEIKSMAFAQRLLEEVKIGEARSAIFAAKGILENHKDLFGIGTPKTYLVLFQNSAELRPTGGFIGSFALVSFSGGKLSDMNIYDVYSSDGQLKGHVEPPSPIKQYLGEAGWYLRDANWDPDFPTSAAKIEWFLDKEMDVSVDGVVAIDLSVIKNLLALTGPVKILDSQTQVDKDNFAQVLQNAIENGFFPGSRKKVNALSSLYDSLLDRIKSGFVDKSSLAGLVYKSLESGGIQVYMHSQPVSNVLGVMDWDGSLVVETCSNNCLSDFVMVNEANLGVNKVNADISRSYALSTTFAPGKLRHSLNIKIKNSSAPLGSGKDVYKVYLRLIVPAGSHTFKTESIYAGSTTALEPTYEEVANRLDVGVWLEVARGQERVINFSWVRDSNLNFATSGEYILRWQKQSGIESAEASGRFYFDGYNKRPVLSSSPKFNLTESFAQGYNIDLARDFEARLSW